MGAVNSGLLFPRSTDYFLGCLGKVLA